MSRVSHLLPPAAAALLLLTACHRKQNSPVAQAQDAATAADDRVAQLEKEIADIKAGKQSGSGDPDVVEHTSKSQLKALDRRLADAKSSAAGAHQEARQIATAPAAEVARTIVVDVPAQTKLSVVLDNELTTEKDQAGDGWTGKLSEPVSVDGRVVWPAGTSVKGVVAQSTASGRLKSGKGGLGIRISTVGTNDVEAGTYLVTGDTRGTRDAKFIGGGAVLGALVGALSSKSHGADHALGGAAIGALAGTGAAAATADTVIRIPAAKAVGFTLASKVKVVLK